MEFNESAYLAELRGQFVMPLIELRKPLPRCARENCVDTTRCVLPFRFYVYNTAQLAAQGVDPATLACIDDTELWEPSSEELRTTDPERACLFWINARTGCKAGFKRVTTLPNWQRGLNHVIFETTDRGIPREFRHRHLGRAAIAQGFSTTDNFVHGVDVSVALRTPSRALALHRRFGGMLPWHRKWLIAFKGEANSPVRARLAGYHNPAERIAIVVYPTHHNCNASGHALVRKTPVRSGGKQQRLVSFRRPAARASRSAASGKPRAMAKGGRPRALAEGASAATASQGARAAGQVMAVSPEREACCASLRSFYNSYDFDDLMNATFAMVLPGRSPASYRLSEVMAAGCIPVFVGLEFAILPYAESIRWAELSLSAPAHVDLRAALFPTLRALANDQPRLRRMQAAVLDAYRGHFAPVDGAVDGNNTDRSRRLVYAHVRRQVIETMRRRFEFAQSFRV
jgi:hypothetical protein